MMFVLPVHAAHAVTFMAAIDQSKWEVEASRFSCRLEQVVPSYGIARFFHKAGEKAVFQLIPTQKGSLSGRVKLVAEASAWQPGMAPVLIGVINMEAGDRQVNVKSDYSGEMLVSLYHGMSPTFTMAGWMGTNEVLRVGLSAANFQKSYNNYIECVDQLLPVNYRQVARTAVLFPPAQWRLSDSTKARLDLIVEYIKADDRVSSVYIDGHSDNAGRRLLNRDLSKQRAEEVTRYLVAQGIEEKVITTRYHGERYPVATNTTAKRRARNRRVAIRLERD